MLETLLALAVGLLLTILILQIFFLLREKNTGLREELAKQSRQLREEVGGSTKAVGDTLVKTLGEMSAGQDRQLDALRKVLSEKLSRLQEDNAAQLEKMRKTVDEKLQGTLERRLGESFRLVSERLEQVYQGLGEMKTLASGVGDLKKVLSNVKVRGNWGEIQLGSLLEQVLSPGQFEKNVAVRKDSNERVEFAIKLPGRDDSDEVVWLPIDAKFPKEDYDRLIDAAEKADSDGVEEAGKQLEQRIKSSAKDICQKYLHPPATTDFGIMFLPSEGLYAEVLRRPGLIDTLQREYRVNVAGPTTLAALLNSLQMGFRTLAIQKRSSDVWLVLGAVKAEFGKFGDVIDKMKKKLSEASNVMEDASRRSRAIERKLREVEQLPTDEAQDLPGLDSSS